MSRVRHNTQSGLMLSLRVILNGTEDDGVTPHRLTYVAIESSLGCFTDAETRNISKTLQENKVPCKIVGRTLEHDNFIAVEVKSMYTATRILTQKGWQIKEEVPFFVWQAVHKHQQKTLLTNEQLETKIGSNIWNQLHPYQKTGVRFAATHQRAYIADEMGTGKTLQSLVSCKYYEELWPVLVVCPSSLRYTWKHEIVNWLKVEEDKVFVVKASKDLDKLVAAEALWKEEQEMKASMPEPSNSSSEDDEDESQEDEDGQGASKRKKKKKKKRKSKKKKKVTQARRGKKLKLPPHKFLIISYSLLAKKEVVTWLKEKQYQVMVLDECHYIKTQWSQRSMGTLEVAEQAQVRYMLSGTPFNYPSEMYNQIRIIDKQIYPWYFDYNKPDFTAEGITYYAKRYCKPHRIRFQNREKWVFKGYERHEELNAVFNTFMIRRRKHEILDQLPPKNRICITLDPLSQRQENEIAKLLKEEKVNNRGPQDPVLGRGAEHKSVKDLAVVKGGPEKYMKSFRLTNQYKIPGVVKFIKEHILEDLMTENKDMKVLIFMHHEVMRQAMEDLLNSKHMTFFVINGATSAMKRDEYTQDFQKTQKYRVGLLSITAAGVGLTLTAANTVIFTEILFGPDQHLQAEDRCHRLGQKSMVNIIYLKTPKTVDDINYGLILKKERESSLMLDGKANMLSTQRVKLGGENQPKLSRLLMPKKKIRVTTKRQASDVFADAEKSEPHRRIRVVRKGGRGGTKPVQVLQLQKCLD